MSEPQVQQYGTPICLHPLTGHGFDNVPEFLKLKGLLWDILNIEYLMTSFGAECKGFVNSSVVNEEINDVGTVELDG